MPEKFGKRIFWCLAVVVIGGGLYLLANSWGKYAGALNIQFEFEKYIPFVPWTVLVYYLIFPYLATPVFTVSKYGDFLKVIGGYFIIIAVSMAIFFLVPTTMPRPEVATDGWPDYLFQAIYFADGRCNLFPSLHVSSASYICFVNWRFCRKYGVLSLVIAIFIVLSTLTTKQHAIIDVLGGINLGLAVYFICFGKKQV